MLKQIGFVAGLMILSNIYDVRAQCCCDFGGGAVIQDNSCSLQALCEWLGGTWYTTPCSSLPIELVYFHAQANGEQVILTWETATEIDNDYFTVERSPDGLNWETVVKVSGAGNSSEFLIYEARDEQPYLGLSYYRLKQTDFDGAYTYSNVVPVQFLTNRPFKIYPNPAKDHIIVTFDSGDNTKLRITDQLGREIFTEMTKGARTVNINTSGLSEGLYFFYITHDNNRFVEKVIVR